MPSLSRGSGCTDSGVIAFFTLSIGPIHIDNTWVNIFRISIVCISIECDWMFDLNFSSCTNNFDVWCSVKNGYIQCHDRLIEFFISDGYFDRVDSIVRPSKVQHTIDRLNFDVGICACSIIIWDIE